MQEKSTNSRAEKEAYLYLSNAMHKGEVQRLPGRLATLRRNVKVLRTRRIGTWLMSGTEGKEVSKNFPRRPNSPHELVSARPMAHNRMVEWKKVEASSAAFQICKPLGRGIFIEFVSHPRSSNATDFTSNFNVDVV